MKCWDCEISTWGEIPAESEINLNLIYETASFSGFWKKTSLLCVWQLWKKLTSFTGDKHSLRGNALRGNEALISAETHISPLSCQHHPNALNLFASFPSSVASLLFSYCHLDLKLEPRALVAYLVFIKGVLDFTSAEPIRPATQVLTIPRFKGSR